MGKKKEKGGLAYLLGLSGQPSAGLALGVVLAVLAALLEVVPYLAVFCALMGIAGAPLGVGALRGMADLPAAAAVAAASALTSLALGFLSSILCHMYAFRVICGIRKALARHLAKLPVSYFRHTSSGKVVQVFQTDVDQLEGFLAHQLPDLVSTVALLIFLVTGMVAFDWRLALVAVAVLAVGFMGQFVPMIKLLKEGALMKNFDALERISSAATEYVHGMPSIKMFGQTPRSFAGFQADIEAYRDFSTSMSRRVGTGVVFFRAVVLSVATFVAPVLVAMALAAPDSAELLPTALFFLVFAPAASAPVCKLRSFSEGMNVLGGSSARVEAIFRERPLPVFGIRAPHGTEVTFDHVGFAYPAKGGGEPAPVLDDVSFTAPAGQITAIVGPSGSGKSTVASLICRFYDAGAGAVCIGGADLRGMNLPPFPLTHRVPFGHDAVNGEGGHGMGHPSPRYSAEFKQQAVRLYRERGGTCAETARELGVDPGSLSDWVRRADAAQAPAGDNPFRMAEDLRGLGRENERPKRENGIPLKASAFLTGRRL